MTGTKMSHGVAANRPRASKFWMSTLARGSGTCAQIEPGNQRGGPDFVWKQNGQRQLRKQGAGHRGQTGKSARCGQGQDQSVALFGEGQISDNGGEHDRGNGGDELDHGESDEGRAIVQLHVGVIKEEAFGKQESTRMDMKT